MAICFRQPVWSAVVSVSSTIVVKVPAGIQNGDLLVAVLMSDQIGSADFTAPGWIFQQDVAAPWLGGENFRAALFTRRASSEPASYTFTSTATLILDAFGLMMALFDDGGASVQFEASAAALGGDVSSFAAPAVTPSGSADPYELIMAIWMNPAGVITPQIGSSIFGGTAVGAGGWAGIAYPQPKGIAVAPVATRAGDIGIKLWAALQAVFKVATPSSRRIMLRGIGQQGQIPPVAVPVPANIANGDLMVAFARGAAAIVAPSGWTPVGPPIDSGKYAAYSRTAAAEPASYIFTNAADESIAAFFHMDGAALFVNIQSLAGPSVSVTAYPGPTLITSFDNEIVICNFSDADYFGHNMTGPAGPADAGGIFSGDLSGVSASVLGELISYFLQPAAGLTASRTASQATAATWYAAQVAIGTGIGGGGGGGGSKTLLTFSQC